MADYRETVDYILGIPLFAQKIGKENLSSLLCRLGTNGLFPMPVGMSCRYLSAFSAMLSHSLRIG